MTSPRSPRVQVTTVTPTPASTRVAMVPPVLMVSSSGCACTNKTCRDSLRISTDYSSPRRLPGCGPGPQRADHFPVDERNLGGKVIRNGLSADVDIAAGRLLDRRLDGVDGTTAEGSDHQPRDRQRCGQGCGGASGHGVS